MRLNRGLLAAAVLGTAAASLSSPAPAHGGGGYRDPPPDSREPQEPPPPPDPSVACGPAREHVDPADDWERWWACNRDDLLGRRRTVPPSRSRLRTTPDTVATVLVPVLRSRLADEEESAHVRSAAAIALARIGDASSAALLRELATNSPRRHHTVVEETSTLALGLLPDDQRTRALLLARLLQQESPFTSRRRPFAAVALGLLGGTADERRLATRALLDVVECETTIFGMRPSCFVALGLIADASAVPELVLMTGVRHPADRRRQLSDVERAFAVEALGRIGASGADDAALRAVTTLVAGRRDVASRDVRRSSTIALGRIAARADARDQRAAATLLRTVAGDESADDSQRHAALISLGRLAASAHAEPRLRLDVTAALRTSMRRNHRCDAPFAAIALGLVGRAVAAEGGTPEDEIRAPLRERFAEQGDLRVRGACALALGLARDPLAAPALLAVLKDAGESHRVRGWSALALGMIGERTAVEAIRDTLKSETDRDLRVQAAMAAGLIGDVALIEDLTAVIRNADCSNHELGSAALALGRIGDERAIAALVDIAIDTGKRYPDVTRGFAVVALGQLGDRRDVPAFAPVSTDCGYLACDPAIDELGTIF